MPTEQAYGQGPAGRDGEAGPFLVSTDQTLTDTAPRYLIRAACLERPIRVGDLVMVNQGTGETRPLRCQRNGCPDCIGVNAFRRALAVGHSEPTHELTLTTTDLHRSSEPWPTIQNRLRVLRQSSKRDGVDLGTFGAFVEQGDETGMTHVHITVKNGQRLDFDWFRSRATSAGFAPRFTYSQIRSAAELASYVGKGFASYAVKGYRADAEDALRLNGGRVGHFSRGFFPDGVRRAEVESLAAWSATKDEPSPWVTRVWT